ncbi:hypothetical protein ACP70R_037299 [Stipagrostis hirtigluma subsp. patula]
MEEIRRVLEEATDEVDLKVLKIERPEEEKEDDKGEEYGDDDTTEEEEGGEEEKEEKEDDDDDEEECLPYLRDLDPRSLCAAASSYTVERAGEIADAIYNRDSDLLTEWLEMAEKKITPLPAMPLYTLPEITRTCALGGECYHREYWTDIISETAQSHPYFSPCDMMQVFSLRLSSTLAHPISIYGTFAVRDCWEPCPNYLFKRSRDDPAIIAPGCSFLPLRSPCRGIYVLKYILLEVKLWIKEEGDISADKPLFCGYVELDATLSGYESKLKGQFVGNYHSLDMHYAFMHHSIETVIEVLAEAEHSSDVKMSAFTSGFDDEIALYNGTFCGTGRMVKHFIGMRKLEELHFWLKLNDSVYKWAFQAGVGVLKAPEHPVSGFAQYFVVNVSFRTQDKAASAWQWSCIGNNVRVVEILP